MWQWQGSALAVGHVRVDFQIRPVVCVGRLPFVFVAFKLTAVTDERCFRCQGQHLSFLADPVVVHALGILGVTHKARHIQAAIDFKLVTNNADHGDPLASPFVLLKDFVSVDLAVPHTGAVSLTRTLGLAVDGAQVFVFRCTLKRCGVAGVQIKRSGVVVNVVVIRNAYSVLIKPVAD